MQVTVSFILKTKFENEIWLVKNLETLTYR